MDNSSYVALNRQAGLLAEMRTVANNIANMSTTGFRKEGVVFAEHVADLGPDAPSLSMATAEGRVIDLSQGGMSQTGATYDVAIEGDGFFQIETPAGNLLTRAGSFGLSAEGELVTDDGYRVLDAGGAPIALPAGAASVSIGQDGTISADGQPVAQLGVFMPTDVSTLTHAGGTRLAVSSPLEVASDAKIFQGFLENSNVNPVAEITRMIEVQRAYEMGQGLLDKEDERIRNTIQTLGRS